MERTFHFFHYKQAILHYSIYGTGSKPLFCFHGFGLDGSYFYELEKHLATDYTIYNFDLFFHGKSEWKDGDKRITKEFLAALIGEFNKEKNISTFSLLGYSIGARLVWTIVEAFPDKVKEITVAAPDGITTRFWYGIATGSVITRNIFRLLLSHKRNSSILFSIGKFFHLAPSLVLRFAESQLQTPEQRNRVYKTWVTFRKLKADPKALAEQINHYNIQLTIYLGKHDKIITYKNVKPLVEKVEKKKVITLEAGHSNLIQKISFFNSTI